MTRRTRGRARQVGKLGVDALATLEGAGRPYGSLLDELRAGVTPRARQAARDAHSRAAAVRRWTRRR